MLYKLAVAGEKVGIDYMAGQVIHGADVSYRHKQFIDVSIVNKH